ncbi:MAG TPA: bifunctional 4-hydroxy-2-oxoglutarate aldolase/2-dehydro-3-deoxy-phosphogluconate aldolase [Acidobacteriaceae bacterium]|jgi:2-dehydro-3-deoxyphosphogluconate aldolase/(4S)-4-hydroxy-2-oxoglutarate aldolase|nr:bifunctional 4-hydroxy-2-oxoglutarate aldolase/2-dehydro-3-deoxy-phosphogluconate aldolase [Acidobacteriaceae bacterium]
MRPEREGAMTIRERLERSGIMPVLRARTEREGHALVQALVAGGITVMEVTMTVPGAVELLGALKAEYGDRLLLGSGTVTTAEQAAATIEAGAEFVVSPSFHPEVVGVTREMGKVSIPGALTPTEVITAWRAGADYVKVFPCSAMGGASYLKSLLAPFPELRLIPTGGVTLGTAADFLQAGAKALGVGTDLVNPQAIEEGRPETVTAMARAYVEVVEKFRSRASAGEG